MATRLRYEGGRLRSEEGARVRCDSSDYCCEPPTTISCNPLLADYIETWKPTWTASVVINGLATSDFNDFPGVCDCSPVMDGGFIDGGVLDWLPSESYYGTLQYLGCDVCRSTNSGPSTLPCYIFLVANISCASGQIKVTADLYTGRYVGDYSIGLTNHSWRIGWEGLFNPNDYSVGSAYNIPHSFSDENFTNRGFICYANMGPGGTNPVFDASTVTVSFG